MKAKQQKAVAPRRIVGHLPVLHELITKQGNRWQFEMCCESDSRAVLKALN